MRGMSAREEADLEALARSRGAKIVEYRPVVAEETPAEARKSEKQFQADVVRQAKRDGWMAYHTYDSRRSAAGFLDIELVRTLPGAPTGRIIKAELKVEGGKETPAQREWADAYRATGLIEVYLWFPKDWPDILKILA